MKLLDHLESGAIVAAPTSSLPEHIGGVRNWDYRYAWVRDAAFSVYALHRIGLPHEAAAFLSWVLDAVERKGAPRIMYTLNGTRPPDEVNDPELEGYRRSKPSVGATPRPIRSNTTCMERFSLRLPMDGSPRVDAGATLEQTLHPG